jgi:hypothetical protein
LSRSDHDRVVVAAPGPALHDATSWVASTRSPRRPRSTLLPVAQRRAASGGMPPEGRPSRNPHRLDSPSAQHRR